MAETLTIGIPTFNGSAFISEAIESVLSSLSPDNVSRVDILVSDNASTDDTTDIVRAYAAQHPGVVSLQVHGSNIGYDANVDSLFRSASAGYVHILGDDDLLVPGALDEVLCTIDNNPDVAVLVGQVSFLDIGSNVTTQGNIYEVSGACDGNAFFLITKWGTCAVSSLVFRRDAWLEHDLAKYVGTQWIHSAAAMNILSAERVAYVLAKDLVTVRTGNPRWSVSNGNQLYLGMIYMEMISEMNDLGYDPDVFDYYLADRYRTNPRDIVSHRAERSRDNLKTAAIMARIFRGKPRFWIIDLPLLVLPAPFIRTLRSATSAVLNRWRQ